MTEVTAALTNWDSLFKIGGAAAALLILYSLATMIQLVVLGGQPKTAAEGFALLQKNKLVGLLRLDLPTLVVMPLYYVLFLALYAALKETHAAYTLLATVLAFAGVTLVLATPSALSFTALSDKFAAATTDVQRGQLLAAGEAILASDLWHGSGANMGAILLQTAGVLISVIMLKYDGFSAATAYIGIVTQGLDLAHILLGFFFPRLGVILMAIAGPLYLVWFPLLALGLFRLG